MIDKYIKEFVAITDFLISTGRYKKNQTHISVPQTDLKAMLDKNLYETSQNKLKKWKMLNWIDADEDHVTKKVYMKGDNDAKGRYIRCVKINIRVYEALKELGNK